MKSLPFRSCLVLFVSTIALVAADYPTVTPGSNIIAFTGAHGEDFFKDVVQLSDNTILVAGRCSNLDWVPSSVTPTELAAGGIDSHVDSTYGFLMQLSSDGAQVLAVVHFTEGTVQDISRIRTTNTPWTSTGDMYISGTRMNSARTTDHGFEQNGYFIAKLNNNFVKGVPTSCVWTYDADCPSRRAGGNTTGISDYGEIQPWDVGNDGTVVYARGADFDWDWAIIEKLDADGAKTTVRYWRTHWTDQSEIGGTLDEYDNSQGAPSYSGIVMKLGRGSLRSWTQEDYDLWQDDANGGKKKGKWPNDYYFNGPKGSSTSGRGYTGYKKSDKPTARVGGIVIDRRNNHLYFGYNNQSVLPDGNPDFEPAVVAMDDQGRLKWWSRLYPEFIDKDNDGTVSSGDETTSTPDQYVDGLAIDYSAPDGGVLVVAARCHGNNNINFWRGNEITYQGNPGNSFQHKFTGTNGNIHLSWVGRFSLDKEEIRHATYVAEMNEGSNTQGSLTDELVEGWYNPNAGWPNLNSTRIQPNTVKIDDAGSVYILGSGRRTITTTNAYMQMPKPDEGHSIWNKFLRVYKRDLTGLVYSSIFQAPWDISTQSGGAHTDLFGVWPVDGGALMVGGHSKDADDNTSMTSANVPSWAASTPAEQRWEKWEVVNGKNKLTAYRNNYDGFFGIVSFSKPASPVAHFNSSTPEDHPGIRFLTRDQTGRFSFVAGAPTTNLTLYSVVGRRIQLVQTGTTARTVSPLSRGSYVVVAEHRGLRFERKFIVAK